MNQTRKSQETAVSQRYLEAASNILLATSPSVSAFLSSQRQHPHGFSPEGPPSKCNACGQILVPGWSCKVTKRKPQKSSGPVTKSRKGSKKDTTTKIDRQLTIQPSTQINYECSLCHNKTTVKSSTEPLSRRSRSIKTTANSIKQNSSSTAQTVQPIAQSAATVSSKPTSTATRTATLTASSPAEQPRMDNKKRNRKQKQGGLQALLAKSKASAAPSSGFDLMDFMKLG